jgi:serine/threonine-protein kinase RsbW
MNKVVGRSLDSLAVLVDMVREFLQSESLPEQVAFDIDLVLEELFTNIVRHGRGTGEIEVGLSHAPGEVHILLRTDEPSPLDPTAAPRANTDLPMEQRRPGGLGIHFVRQLSHAFRYEWNGGVGTTIVVVGVKT